MSSSAQNDSAAPSIADELKLAIAAAQTEAPTESEKEQTLDELITSANLQYSLKNYDAAAEVYSKATERQATERGEMEPENAELLFLYGRCLYKVAVSRSDVLGGQVAGEAPKRDQGKSRDDSTGDAKGESQGKAPFIAVGGVDTDSEDEDEEGDGEAAEEEDDFATAYEVLDLSRVLFEKKIALLSTDAMDTDIKGKGKATDNADAPLLTPELRHVKDRLADTHDLQAEISLENERFADAVMDGQATLKLRLEIESPDSELIAEAYYKLALAQEFTFFTSVREAKEAQQNPDATSSGTAGTVEPKMLYDAVENLVKAIESCELRVKNEEATVASLSPQDASAKRLKIAEVKAIVEEMNTRLADLHTTAKSLGPTLAPHLLPTTITRLENLKIVDPEPPAEAAAEVEAAGTLAEMPGESAAERQARIQKAAQGATDISGLVRSRKSQKPAANENGVNGKRKLEDDDDTGSDKRVRFDE